MKLQINKKQLNVIVNHIKESETKSKLVESWDGVVYGTALLMGIELTGINKKTAEKALNDVSIIKQIKQHLESEDINKIADTLEKSGMSDAIDRLESSTDVIERNFDELVKKHKLNINLIVYDTRFEDNLKNK